MFADVFSLFLVASLARCEARLKSSRFCPSVTKKLSGRTEKVMLFKAFLQAGLTHLYEIWPDWRS